VDLGQERNIPVHTQIRLAHDVAQSILDTINAQHVDLTLMGWKGSTETPGRIFGNTVDTLIRQAACEVVLVKLGDHRGERRQSLNLRSPELVVNSPLKTQKSSHLLTFDRWLVPMAGGPNAQEAVKLLPALSKISNEPEVRLCQVFKSAQPSHDTTVLEQAAQFLRHYLNSPVLITPVCSSSVPEAVIDLAQKDQCDVIMLGASRERLLQQVMKGNIPEEIARNCNCTVILVRGA
jgi:CIC family chloride channel protein